WFQSTAISGRGQRADAGRPPLTFRARGVLPTACRPFRGRRGRGMPAGGAKKQRPHPCWGTDGTSVSVEDAGPPDGGPSLPGHRGARRDHRMTSGAFGEGGGNGLQGGVVGVEGRPFPAAS